MSRNLGEIVVSLVFVVLLVLKLDPFRWAMPSSVEMLLLALVIVAFGVYAGLFYRERARDEREALHLSLASRSGYMAGVALLVIGIAVESLTGRLDSWLVTALVVMVVVKMAALVWARSRR